MHKRLTLVGRDGASAAESTFSGQIGHLIPGGKGDTRTVLPTAQTSNVRNQTTPTLPPNHDELALILDKLVGVRSIGSIHTFRETGNWEFWYSMEGVSGGSMGYADI